MGLPLHGTLYGCPQSLFKFHPDFDSILADILTRDPSGHVIVIESGDSRWDEALRTRWAQRFPVVSERTVFLPRQPLDRFMGLMAHFDVLLDPVHFGSGNTLYEAMVYGTPIVTWPAEFMRGRIVAAAYRQMGVKGAPIAKDFSDYARIAAELGTNEQLRRELRAEIVRGARANLFKDLRAVREFEDFLAASVEAARNGQKLPEDWRSSSGMEELQR
jgi:predicted O-linked N-acetylglucosamine transferase (SPINDLY family)